MADISGVDPVGLFVVIGFIILCLILVFVFSKLERKVNKTLPEANQQSRETSVPVTVSEVSPEGKDSAAFIVGQVYQMEDGTLAKYAGNGQFHKIKPE